MFKKDTRETLLDIPALCDHQYEDYLNADERIVGICSHIKPDRMASHEAFAFIIARKQRWLINLSYLWARGKRDRD